MWLRNIYMSLSALRQVSARPIIAYPRQITCSFAGDDDLARAGELVGDIANVTLYVKEFNKWTPEDLQLPNNNILSHFTFDNTQPSLSSTSNVVFPPYTKALLDGLAKKRELAGGDEVSLYAS
jgi:hypothetical protein